MPPRLSKGPPKKKQSTKTIRLTDEEHAMGEVGRVIIGEVSVTGTIRVLLAHLEDAAATVASDDASWKLVQALTKRGAEMRASHRNARVEPAPVKKARER